MLLKPSAQGFPSTSTLECSDHDRNLECPDYLTDALIDLCVAKKPSPGCVYIRHDWGKQNIPRELDDLLASLYHADLALPEVFTII